MIITLTVAVIEFLLWLYLTNSIFTPKHAKRTNVVIYTILFVVLALKLVFLDSYLNDIAAIALIWGIYLIAMHFLFFGSIWKKIAWYIFFVVALAVPEIVFIQLAQLIFRDTPDNLLESIPLLITVIILARLSTFLAIKLISSVKGASFIMHKAFMKEVILIIIIDAIILIGSAYLYMNPSLLEERQEILFSIANLCFCVVVVITLALVFKISQKSEEIIQNSRIIQQLEGELHLATQIEISEANLKAIRHNISNIFGIIKGLLDINAYQELNDYLSGIEMDIQNANELIFLENKALSIILNNKNAKRNPIRLFLKALLVSVR